MTEELPQRVIRSSKRLPSGRAIFGGLLITLAVLGVLLATQLGDDATFRPVVVAREDLAPGTVIEPHHVAQITARLDESATFVVEDPNELYGSVVLGPIARLEFVQRSSVRQNAGTDAQTGVAEVSIAVEPERAPDDLATGELVSVYATFDSEDGSPTVLIADRVVVLSYETGSEDFSTADAVLRLGLADGDTAARIVNADRTGEVSVIGVTGAPTVRLPEQVRR